MKQDKSKPHLHQLINQLIDQEMKAETDLREINTNIQELETKVIGRNWWDGNLIINWSRYLNDQSDKQLFLHPKDHIFSLSSVTSQMTGELLKIQNCLLNKNEINAKTQARKKFVVRAKKADLKQKYNNKDKLMKIKLERRRKIKRIRKPTIKNYAFKK